MFGIKKEKNNASNLSQNKTVKKGSFFDAFLKPVNKNQAAKIPGIESYHDPEGLTLRQMNFSLWIVEHRHQIIMVPFVILIIICALTWGYVIFGLSYYVLFGMKQDDKLASELTGINVNFIRPEKLDLQFGKVETIENENNKYDFAVMVNNQNKKYWAEIEYQFIADGRELKLEKGFILPDESKYLLSINQDSGSAVNNSELRINNIAWYLLNQHKYPDWKTFWNEHMNITVSDKKFTPAKSTILAEKLYLNDLQFTVTNNTAYNYLDTNFVIILFSQGRVIGANNYKISNFLSGQTRQTSITWQGRLGRVDEIVITPEMNIVRDDIYLDFQGDIGDLK